MCSGYLCSFACIATFAFVGHSSRTVVVELEQVPVDSAHFHRPCIVLLELLHYCLAADLDMVVVAEPIEN